MFQNVLLSEHIAKDCCGLIDNRGERDAIDDPVHPMSFGMIERKTERGECLAATSRHFECEHAARQGGLAASVGKDMRSQCTQRAMGTAGLDVSHVCIKADD